MLDFLLSTQELLFFLLTECAMQLDDKSGSTCFVAQGMNVLSLTAHTATSLLSLVPATSMLVISESLVVSLLQVRNNLNLNQT